MIDLRDPDERAAAAGEYVLGTLAPGDHAAVAEALRHDTVLLAEVYAWQDRLLPLSARSPAQVPGAALWPRIERSLGPARAAPAVPASASPVAPRRLRFWQGLSALAAALSIALAVALGVQMMRAPSSEPRYIAMLDSPDRQATGWVVELRAGGTLRLAPVGAVGTVPAGRAWQFWTKLEGAAAPTSLGLVRPGQVLELPASQLPGVGERQLFEITLEPEGGSPVGRPTGPILYVGRTVAL